MKRRPIEQESVLEIGLAMFAASIVAAFVMLLYGRASGSARQGAMRSRQAPANGSLPPERHQNTRVVATR